LRLVQELGLKVLRYGLPYYSIHRAPGKFDWSFADEVMNEIQRLNITPILDLLHFGVPSWVGDFQNPELPTHFADFADAVAARYPWVRFYTPINEIYVCAKFSAQLGWWNEREQSDRAFVTALKHMCLATLAVIEEILAARPDAIFVQSESTEHFHQSCTSEEAGQIAAFENDRRFLALDALYAHPLSTAMERYVRENGVTTDELARFMNNTLGERCIMGNDYYVTNEHLLVDETHSIAAGEVFGYYVVTEDYYRRYNLPVMHTETNLWEGQHGDEAVKWLWKEWANVLRLRNVGIPTVGFTWYSLTDQVDWDTALREKNGNVNPLGLFDLDRKIRNVGRAYKQLIADWRDVLPSASVCLVVPIKKVSENTDEDAAGRILDPYRLDGG